MEKVIFALFLCLAVVQGDLFKVIVGYAEDGTTFGREAVFDSDAKEFIHLEGKGYLVKDSAFAQKMLLKDYLAINNVLLAQVKIGETTFHFRLPSLSNNVTMEDADDGNVKIMQRTKDLTLVEIARMPNPKINSSSWWLIGYTTLIQMTTAEKQQQS